MVPGSFGCGSAVLAATIILAPSRAAFNAIALPIPREAPVMKIVRPASFLLAAKEQRHNNWVIGKNTYLRVLWSFRIGRHFQSILYKF